MIYLLYGADTYRSRRKLNEIIDGYRSKAGSDLDFHRLDAEESDLSVLKNLAGSRSLFSAKKLIVVENALTGKVQFDFIATLGRDYKGSNHGVLVFWDRDLDEASRKRLKEIESSLDKIQEFKLLTNQALQAWLQEEAGKRGLKLFPVHLSFLASYGSDLWALTNELDKMAALGENEFSGENKNTSTTIFELGDTFFTAQKNALPNLLNLLGQGLEDFNIFSYLVNHNRTLLTVKNYLERGREVPSHHKIHPYVIKKASALLREISREKLQSSLQRFFEEDYKIKIGVSSPRDSLLYILARPKT